MTKDMCRDNKRFAALGRQSASGEACQPEVHTSYSDRVADFYAAVEAGAMLSVDIDAKESVHGLWDTRGEKHRESPFPLTPCFEMLYSGSIGLSL